MPIYSYRCDECGHAKDVLQKISDPPLGVCPSCGASAFRKQVTAAGFQLKGSGWYATDFRNPPAGKDGAKSKDAPNAGASDTAANDAKPAAASDSGAKESSSSPATGAATPAANKTSSSKPPPASSPPPTTPSN